MERELEVFVRAKRDEGVKSKRHKYFTPQVVGAGGESEATDIGKELAFMTAREPTKFVSIVAADESVEKRGDKLWFSLACATETFDPSALVKLVYVRTGTLDFARFAALLFVLYGYGWPLFGSSAARPRDAGKRFLARARHYRPELGGAYIGYILGYRMDDIVAWGRGGAKEFAQETNESVARSCEAFVREAVASRFIRDLAEEAGTRTANAIAVMKGLR